MFKEELRKRAKKIRASINDKQRQESPSKLKHNLCDLLKSINILNNSNKTIVATYYPFGTEIVPPHQLDKCNMALPVIRDKTLLEFYLWEHDQPVIKSESNISIPDTRFLEPVLPHIILLPLLLCDTYGNRIGYGAGHYDRYIASLSNKPYLIGVCYEEQIYERLLPAEPHDVRLDAIVSPERVIKIQ